MVYKSFLGYLKSDEREAVKNPKESCLFVFKSLFENREEELSSSYEIEKEFDFENLRLTPGLFDRSSKDKIVHFLCYGGIKSTDLEQCMYIRGFQTFQRVSKQQVTVGTKYLVILSLGQVGRLTCKRRGTMWLCVADPLLRVQRR